MRLLVDQMAKNPSVMQNTWVRKTLEEDMATHSNILAWRIPTDRAWRAPSGVHGVANSWTRLEWLSTAHSRDQSTQDKNELG